MLQYPEAIEPNPEAMFLYPTALEKHPALKLQTPTAVDESPEFVATIVPVITPVLLVSVAPLALFKIPIPTDASPVPVKLDRPKIWELVVVAVEQAPTTVEKHPEAVL